MSYVFYILFAMFLLNSVSLSLVAKLCPTLATPWTVARKAPLSMGFSRQECWSELPFPSPGDLPDPGIKPESPALQLDSLPTELWGSPHIQIQSNLWKIPPHVAKSLLMVNRFLMIMIAYSRKRKQKLKNFTIILDAFLTIMNSRLKRISVVFLSTIKSIE